MSGARRVEGLGRSKITRVDALSTRLGQQGRLEVVLIVMPTGDEVRGLHLLLGMGMHVSGVRGHSLHGIFHVVVSGEVVLGGERLRAIAVDVDGGGIGGHFGLDVRERDLTK